MVSATMAAADITDIGHRLEEKGLRVLDAPVSGGAAKAEAGEIKSGELIAHILGAQFRISEGDYELFLRTRRGANLTKNCGQR